MTKGEEQLRQKLSEDLVLELLDPVDLFVVWDKVVEIVKSGEYFVHAGEICQVEHESWLDWDDSVVYRHIGHEDPNPEFDDEEDE